MHRSDSNSWIGRFHFATVEQLELSLSVVRHCVDQLSDEQLWMRPQSDMNSIANLLLHIAGNLRQWLICGLTDQPDHRRRQAEFDDRSLATQEQLLRALSDTVAQAIETISKQTPEDLERVRRVQEFDLDGFQTIQNSTSHFQGHAQEIVYMTRALLGDSYRFRFVPQENSDTAPAGPSVSQSLTPSPETVSAKHSTNGPSQPLPSPTIVLCYPVEDRHLTLYEQHLPEATIINAGQEGVGQRIFEADLFVGHAKVPVDWARVVEQGRLRLIQSSAAGLDHCLVPSVIESEIAVCSASGLFANQVGEQALTLLLGLLRGIPIFCRQTLQRQFVRQPTDDLHGKRVGIVGLGGNGRRLAELLQPFDVEIRATDYYPVRRPANVRDLWPADRLCDLAACSDVLILALPLNQNTQQLISKTVIRSMPKGSYLINVARGQVVDEAALIEALTDGHLAGAGVDVTYHEPLPADSPLWTLDNVLITPHVGAQSARRVDDSTAFACENLRRFLDGQALLNVVDKRLGFPHPDVMVVNQSVSSGGGAA